VRDAAPGDEGCRAEAGAGGKERQDGHCSSPQLCPKSVMLPQRQKPDSLQRLLIIQSQFVPSRRA